MSPKYKSDKFTFVPTLEDISINESMFLEKQQEKMHQTLDSNHLKEAYKEIYKPRRAKKQQRLVIKPCRGSQGLRVSSLLENYKNSSKENSLEGDRKRDLASSMTLSYSNAGISSKQRLYKKDIFN